MSISNAIVLDIFERLDLLQVPLSFYFLLFLKFYEILGTELVVMCNKGSCLGNIFSCISLLWTAHLFVWSNFYVLVFVETLSLCCHG